MANTSRAARSTARLSHERRRVPAGHELHRHAGPARRPDRQRRCTRRRSDEAGRHARAQSCRAATCCRADLADIAAKLRAHNIRVTTLDKPMRVEGEEFPIKQMRKVRSGGYDMTTLDGAFAPLRDARIPGRHVLRRHGAADGQRGVLLPGAAGARRLRRLGRARRRLRALGADRARPCTRSSRFVATSNKPSRPTLALAVNRRLARERQNQTHRQGVISPRAAADAAVARRDNRVLFRC